MRGPLYLFLFAALPVLGCSDAPAPADPKPAAAVIQRPVTEADLTTVTLTPEAAKRLDIQTARVVVEPVARTRTVGGEIVVPPGKTVAVSAPVAGTLVAPQGGVPQSGARVSRGQRIFTLRPLLAGERDLRIEAERDAAASAAEADAAKRRLARLEELLKEGAASMRAVEEARAQAAVAAAALEAAQNRLATVGGQPIDQRGEMAIESPLDGVLRAVTAAPGQTVAASLPLFDVIAVDTVWVRVPLYAGELANIDASQPTVVLPLGASGPPVLAQRVAAPPSADVGTATVDLFFALPNTGARFRPGERVSVRLPLGTGASGRVVPTSAILYDNNGGTWVYEARPNNVYVRQRVEIATFSDAKAVLARGPVEGVSVVVTGAAELFGTEFGAGK